MLSATKRYLATAAAAAATNTTTTSKAFTNTTSQLGRATLTIKMDLFSMVIHLVPQKCQW